MVYCNMKTGLQTDPWPYEAAQSLWNHGVSKTELCCGHSRNLIASYIAQEQLCFDCGSIIKEQSNITVYEAIYAMPRLNYAIS